MRDIRVNNIKDSDIRDALVAIRQILLEDLPILRGEWQYFEIEVSAAGTYTEKHNLGFTPKDILITYDTATITINYTLTNSSSFIFTAANSGVVRGFYGNYEDKEIS